MASIALGLRIGIEIGGDHEPVVVVETVHQPGEARAVVQAKTRRTQLKRRRASSAEFFDDGCADCGPQARLGHLVCGLAEDDDIVFADMLKHLDIGAIERARW